MKSIRRMGYTRTEIGIPSPAACAEGGVRAIRDARHTAATAGLSASASMQWGKRKNVSCQRRAKRGRERTAWKGKNYRGENVLAVGLVLVRSRGLNGNDRGNCLKKGWIPPCAPRAAAQCTPCIVGCESRHGVTHEDPPLRNRARLRARTEINSRVTLTKVPWAVKAEGKAQIRRKGKVQTTGRGNFFKRTIYMEEIQSSRGTPM